MFYWSIDYELLDCKFLGLVSIWIIYSSWGDKAEKLTVLLNGFYLRSGYLSPLV